MVIDNNLDEESEHSLNVEQEEEKNKTIHKLARRGSLFSVVKEPKSV